MRTAYITVGVPASGKTTWANEFIKKSLVGIVNINRDDLRAIVHEEKTGDRFSWKTWNRKWEKEVMRRRQTIIDAAVADSTVEHIIFSDTNLNEKMRNALIEDMTTRGFEINIITFAITYEEAVKRDVRRDNPVGAIVIGQMIHKFNAQFGEKQHKDPRLPQAVLIDVDGTLAHITDRNIYDFDKVHTDAPDPFVVPVVKGLKTQGLRIIVFSGRDDVCYTETRDWVTTALEFEPDAFYMRVTGDKRSDDIVKQEMYDKHIRGRYHIIGVIDDRPKVVRMWHRLGLKVLAVGDQHNEF